MGPKCNASTLPNVFNPNVAVFNPNVAVSCPLQVLGLFPAGRPASASLGPELPTTAQLTYFNAQLAQAGEMGKWAIPDQFHHLIVGGKYGLCFLWRFFWRRIRVGPAT